MASNPGPDVVVRWTRDGKRELFYSGRDAVADSTRLYTVPAEGGPAQALPMWRGEAASFSPDGTRIAYVPNEIWQTAWKRYRGGKKKPIFIVKLKDLTLGKVKRTNFHQRDPGGLVHHVH